MKFLKSLIIGMDTGKISTTKVWLWIAAFLTGVGELNAQLTTAGVAIPEVLIPFMKIAGIASAIIAGMKLRNSKTPVK